MRRSCIHKVIARRRPSFGAFVLLLALGLAGHARAQLGASLGLESDYRLRGLLLSDGQPAMSAAIAYDHPSGVYLGGSVAGQLDARLVAYGGYLGYASRKTMDMSWDVGVSRQSIAADADRPTPMAYTEIYAGLNASHWSTHVSYSPAYLRPGAQTVYVDVSGAYRPWDNWRLFGHIGALTPLGGYSQARERYDATAGIARSFDRFEVRLSWSGASPPQSRSVLRDPSGLALGASYFF